MQAEKVLKFFIEQRSCNEIQSFVALKNSDDFRKRHSQIERRNCQYFVEYY